MTELLFWCTSKLVIKLTGPPVSIWSFSSIIPSYEIVLHSHQLVHHVLLTDTLCIKKDFWWRAGEAPTNLTSFPPWEIEKEKKASKRTGELGWFFGTRLLRLWPPNRSWACTWWKQQTLRDVVKLTLLPELMGSIKWGNVRFLHI